MAEIQFTQGPRGEIIAKNEQGLVFFLVGEPPRPNTPR